ncbi:MAG: winged helix-turn-helix transcriptional regulator [Candidatus Hermodarchaeota archaeon]
MKAIKRDQNTLLYNTKRIGIKAKMYKNIFNLIQGKWTLEIYFTLIMVNTCGFNELKDALPKINSRTLTDRLRFLEQNHIVSRKVITDSPIRVNYSLTDFGKEALTLLIPFLVYFLLPKHIKKSFPKIQNIEKQAKELITQELEKPI